MKMRFIIFGFIILFCISCRIEKRHYMKGYDISFYHPHKNTHTNNLTKIAGADILSVPPKIKPIENNIPILSIDTFIKKEPKTYYADVNKKIYMSKIFPLMKEWKRIVDGDYAKNKTKLGKTDKILALSASPFIVLYILFNLGIIVLPISIVILGIALYIGLVVWLIIKESKKKKKGAINFNKNEYKSLPHEKTIAPINKISIDTILIKLIALFGVILIFILLYTVLNVFNPIPLFVLASIFLSLLIIYKIRMNKKKCLMPIDKEANNKEIDTNKLFILGIIASVLFLSSISLGYIIGMSFLGFIAFIATIILSISGIKTSKMGKIDIKNKKQMIGKILSYLSLFAGILLSCLFLFGVYQSNFEH